MTTAAWDVDCASGVMAARIAADCLHDGPIGAVGLELEAHCYDVEDPARRPGWDELAEAIAAVPSLPGGSAITVEPGGAVELSGPPADGVSAAITALTADHEVLRTALARRGLGLVLLGTDPMRPAQRIHPGPRYRAMEQFFARSGAAGAAMMTSTASVQVNIEAGPREGWADRVRLAHALGPVMIAVAANSPLLGGQFTGWRSTRQRVWGQIDAARCGPVLGRDGDDPGADWARYALRAPVMLVRGTDPDTQAEAATDWVTFADWADGRAALGGRLPTADDLDYHLTTLFPPVRPRRWLEIRYLDSVPDDVWPAVVFTLVTLMDNPVAAATAVEATAPVATEWDLAARVGLADPRLKAAAERCVAAAAEHAPDQLAEPMERLLRNVSAGRCPADDFSASVLADGIPSTLRRLAKGES
ncbi:glutamate--cysteine ligase [Mycolicibacterium canariasense]|uniref:Glutamate--cysteine ligase EgtA n=1 Tax=Mycolicibacterium canariasense TaxID=228230 RepID=A0A100WJQ4_MYCCR|nr:ergothioneine biosynthesis glutamate--cysteine ligase EgtA [Mycolicibacterium canariasense]MCV7207193.1 ergothioneine biosynthesis glutamate--cysteine ligase EgtA [Mycolicibacterium canariasense]GAS99552.1 glutamate--cysteine ligase [Mycolicibacterium canariasense]